LQGTIFYGLYNVAYVSVRNKTASIGFYFPVLKANLVSKLGLFCWCFSSIFQSKCFIFTNKI